MLITIVWFRWRLEWSQLRLVTDVWYEICFRSSSRKFVWGKSQYFSRYFIIEHSEAFNLVTLQGVWDYRNISIFSFRNKSRKIICPVKLFFIPIMEICYKCWKSYRPRPFIIGDGPTGSSNNFLFIWREAFALQETVLCLFFPLEPCILSPNVPPFIRSWPSCRWIALWMDKFYVVGSFPTTQPGILRYPGTPPVGQWPLLHKEVNPRLLKRTLKTNGRLSSLQLTSR